jgi:hypothetical protein
MDCFALLCIQKLEAPPLIVLSCLLGISRRGADSEDDGLWIGRLVGLRKIVKVAKSDPVHDS